MTINSNNVIADHLWLWRADHGAGAAWDSNANDNGLTVNGNDATVYGLFVEHCQKYQTVWNGEGGRAYFYQSEMPYDPPDQASWGHDGVNGYASYKVGANVKTHEAWGLGVYCAFFNPNIYAENAFETPGGTGIRMHQMLTVSTGGNQGGINHVINGTGAAVNASNPQARVK